MNKIKLAQIKAKQFPNRFTESYNDIAQEKVFQLQSQLKLLEQLQQLPKTEAVILQISDVKAQIQKLLQYMKQTNQSIEQFQSKISSKIQQAEYINALETIRQSQGHKLLDLVNERQVKDDEITRLNQINIASDFNNILKDNESQNQLMRNIRALVQDKQRQQQSLSQLLDPMKKDIEPLIFNDNKLLEQNINAEAVEEMKNPVEISKTELSVLEQKQVKMPEIKTEQETQYDLAEAYTKIPSNQEILQYGLELEFKYGLKKGKLRAYHTKLQKKIIDGINSPRRKYEQLQLLKHFT